MRLVSNLRMRWDMETCFGLSLLFLLLLLLLLVFFVVLLLLLLANEPFSERTEHDAHPDTAASQTDMGALK